MSSGTIQAGVSLPRDTHSRLLALGGGNLSAGVRALADHHFGVTEPPARRSSAGAVWLEAPSFDLLAAAIGAGGRVIAWPTGLLLADPDGTGCVSFERGEISWRDEAGATRSEPLTLGDLEQLCQLLEGAHREAIRRHERGIKPARPIGGRSEISGITMQVTAAGPAGAGIELGGAKVALPGAQLVVAMCELRALQVRLLLLELDQRQHLNDLLARTEAEVIG